MVLVVRWAKGKRLINRLPNLNKPLNNMQIIRLPPSNVMSEPDHRQIDQEKSICLYHLVKDLHYY